MYKNTFDSFSFGCRVNEAEKTVLDSGMIEAGYVQDSLNPDIFIINTCAVTAKAEREARQMILKLKRNNPAVKIVVTGCSATYWEKNGLWRNIPIDLLISNINKNYTVDIIQKRLRVDVKPRTTGLISQTIPHDKFLDSGRVMVKIQDGCHRFCSYCIVPYLRGLPVSRSTGDIVKQVNRYAALMKEVVLTAINTEAFGRDTGESLIGLISRILSETPISRLSFGSIHPWSITDEFLRYYAAVRDNPRFSSFFHVPLQSGSDKMLSLMKRDYARDDVVLKLRQIALMNPHALIATDIIVGFLDETKKDFEDTLSFLEQSPFVRFHIFRFSSRNNTAAHYMRRRLREPTAGEKKARASALQKLHTRKMHDFLQRQIGWTSDALFIGAPEDGFQKAVLNNQVVACIPVNENLSGSMKRVTITELKNGILYGKTV